MSGLSDQERQVFDYLVNAIAERRLAPGMRLVEADLAQEFDISRGQVRKILLALGETQGVRHAPNRGAQVARPSLEEARNVMTTRLLIEPQVAASLSEQPEPQRREAVEKLRAHMELEASAHSRRARGEEIRLSGRFHVLLCEALGNQILAEFVERLVLLASLALATHAPEIADDCGLDEHVDLVDAIERGDPAAARDQMRRHLSHVSTGYERSSEDKSGAGSGKSGTISA
ncbi:GntR family transcriptional regulator [Pseudooceanicola algae]|uniref:HTH-type transcriptional repressor RspR n=1 Tax=Pseudooceanicola algae TaxID=1537215 RepID=A0A418SLJ6_9RHOB|nr:GntR family transcriptional regulator [Pseudooceanicola algae]QPM90564.1 HTH-type transcriptional repressor RspR [Pseudooceanicola algae]